MTILHIPGKLIAFGLLIASLALPSAVFAGEPDKTNGELAPGFNACEKQAADTAKNSAEYKEALLGCLDSAEKYWEPIIKKRTCSPEELASHYSYREIDEAEKNFYQAWIKYKKAGSELIRADDDPMQALRARFFEVKEARRQAILLQHDLFLEIEEEYAPGFNLCEKKASDSTSSSVDYRNAMYECFDLAGVYWTSILKKNWNT